MLSTRISNTLRLLTLTVAATLALVSLVAAQNKDEQNKAKLLTDLTTIAQDKIETENEIIIRGDANKALARKSSASRYRDIIQKDAANLLERRAALAENRIAYTGSMTELAVRKSQIDQTVATLWATEYTVLAMNAPGGPDNTAYEVDHRFQFVREKSGWRMISDEPLTTAPEGPAPGELPIYTTPTRKGQGRSTDDEPNGQPLRHHSPMSNLNRPAIAEYATRYYRSYNTRYRTDANDCTNFASQCMYAGGWPMVSGFYQYDSAWWYNFSAFTSPYHSYTWGGAHNFYLFTYTRPRGVIAQYFSQMKVGDILQVDWNDAAGRDTPDGHIDHTMVVTAKSSTGEIFLTYHSNSVLNKPITELLRLKPRARWYGWRMYDYPS
jgi:hypothetical protein